MFEIAVIVLLALLVLGGGYILWSWITGYGAHGESAETGSANEMSPSTPESANSRGQDGGGESSGGGGGGDGG